MRVAGRDGVPATGLWLLLRPVKADAGPKVTYTGAERRGTTDRDGVLEVHGLRRAPYVVRACTNRWANQYPWLLTSAPIQPGASDVQLSFSRPHVVVRLRDGEGERWNGSGAEVREGWAPRDWPDGPRVYLLECFPVEGVRAIWSGPLPGTQTARDEFVFERWSGTRYVVGAQGGSTLGGSFEGPPLEIELPQDADRVLVELRSTAPRPMGAVAVRTNVAGVGEPALSVQLESLDSGVAIVGTSSLLEGQPFVLRAPPGEYRVVAEGGAIHEPYHGGLQRPRALGRAEAVVRLDAKTTTDLDLYLEEGGNLQIALLASGDLAEFDVPPSLFSSEEPKPSVALFLLSPSGHCEPIYRRRPWLYGDSTTPNWPVGETRLSERLPAGRATLVGRLRSGREVRTAVEIRPGETTLATLEF